MMKLRGLFAAMTFVAMATLVNGDEKTKENPPPSDQHKRLDSLAGEWEVAVNFKAGPEYKDGNATCKAKWELNGNFMVMKYDSVINGKPFEAVQVLGYDPGTKKFTECFFDNMYPAMKHNTGAISADGKTLTLMGEHFDPMMNANRKLRVVYTLTDKDHFTLEWHMSKPEGGEERAVTLKHTRKK